jgi:cytochrome c oxidase assembly protein subunit 11
MDQAAPDPHTSSRHRRVAVVCASFAAVMLGAAFAAVPLYQIFCQVTGYGGTTMRADRPAAAMLDRTMTVRLDANVAPGLKWSFVPVDTTKVVRLGETAVAMYRATNTSNVPLKGTATYNVTPDQAGVFFNKLECFCFTEQVLEPGQSVDMPVQFFVDPALASDKYAGQFSQITLSYTFFPVGDGRVRREARSGS